VHGHTNHTNHYENEHFNKIINCVCFRGLDPVCMYGSLKMRKRKYTPLSAASCSTQYSMSHNFNSDSAIPAPISNIHNLVGTTVLFCSVGDVDLNYVASVMPNSYYDRRRFAAITIRISDPTCTALLFTSGKLVLTGAKSWCQCLLASLHIAKLLMQFCDGVVFKVMSTSIQNIVGNAVIPLRSNQYLDLQAMYDSLGSECTWQPNMFPGLVFRADNSPVVLLCFNSGKIVITGGKVEQDIAKGWENLWPIVSKFINQK
jgi:transcription initiation factor TFIID TATA-box-binding protein